MAEVDIKLPYKLPTFHDWQPHATFYHPLYAGSIDGTDLFPHDKAVVRAMLSTYRPNKNVTGDQSKTLFVARLSKDTSEDTIRNIYEKFGGLEKCRLIRDIVTGFSKGYAFVEFKRKKDALSAAHETHKMTIDGRQILVDFECERTLDGWKPRRFGGGFGGRKESGQLRFGGIDRPFRKPIPANVSGFARGIHGEGGVKQSSREHRDQESGKARDRHQGTYERDFRRCSKDRRGYDRDYDDRGGRHKCYDRREDKGRHEDPEERRDNRRGHDDDHHHKERDHRDRKEKRDKGWDYTRDREDRRDRDDRHRTSRDRHEHDKRYGNKRHRKQEGREMRDEVRSGNSNSSKDPE